MNRAIIFFVLILPLLVAAAFMWRAAARHRHERECANNLMQIAFAPPRRSCTASGISFQLVAKRIRLSTGVRREERGTDLQQFHVRLEA